MTGCGGCNSCREQGCCAGMEFIFHIGDCPDSLWPDLLGNLQSTPGVLAVRADPDTRTLTVVCDDREVSLMEIQKQLEHVTRCDQ